MLRSSSERYVAWMFRVLGALKLAAWPGCGGPADKIYPPRLRAKIFGFGPELS